MRFTHVYFAFAAGYLLSYVYRTINAVISPELVHDLHLAPSSLGLLTSAYLLAFGLCQLPVGILLDRYGPRRVEPVLLVIASAGAALFALAESLTGLTIARAIIGAGVCAALMAPLKALAAWYPPEKQASYAGWIMVAGGVGALVSTVPIEYALRVSHWRVVFAVLSGATLLAALFIFLRVPDMERSAHPPSLRSQVRSVGEIFRHPRFWWIAPLGAMAMGSYMALQGLWAVPWLMEVEGRTRAAAASYLLAMSGVTMMGYLGLGMLGTRLARYGIEARHIFGGGFALSLTALALIALEVPGSLLWWSLFGFGASGNVLGFAALNQGFSREFAGRTNTSLNLLMFAGSFIVQWGVGLVIDAVRLAYGMSTADGLRVAFGIVVVCYVVAFAWFARGFRRYGTAHPAFA